MAGPLIEEIGGGDFDSRVLRADKAVVLDFAGEGCGSCRAMVPVLETLAREHADTVKVFSVDVHKSPDLAARFNVRALPTLVFFKDGQMKNAHVGTLSVQGMLAKLSA